MSKEIHSSYLYNPLDIQIVKRKIVPNAVKQLKEDDFDTIVFRGMSGALIAPIVAMRLNKNILMVRKPSDCSHSGYSGKAEGCVEIDKYVIIDDFISTGHTVDNIISAVKESNSKAKLEGIFLYNADYGSNMKLGRFSIGDHHTYAISNKNVWVKSFRHVRT